MTDTPKKIEKLTPEQEAAIPGWRDKWIAIGLSTEPANRPAAEEGVRLAYIRGGKTPPKRFIWADSPLAGAREAAKIANGVDEPTREQIAAQAGWSLWGQHDAGWLAWGSFWQQVCPLPEGVEPVDVTGLVMVAENAGWWWAFTETAILTERPAKLFRDDWGRLHNTVGAALEYPDGFGVYAINGTRVPAWVIMETEKITPELCDAETNLEIRRVMIARMGADKYMAERGGKLVHRDDFGELWRIDRYYTETEEALAMVKVVNATPNPDGSFKDYWIQVPPDMKTAREAVAWTFDVPEGEYLLTAAS